MRFIQKLSLLQIQLILLNISTQAYNIPLKKKNQPPLSRGHQTVTMIMNYCCYCFDGLWKVKPKYIVLCSNALAKLQNVRGTSRHPVLKDNCPTCSDMARSYQSTEWFILSPFQVVCKAWDSVTTRVVLLEKMTWNICR